MPLSKAPMITVEEALAAVAQAKVVPRAETVPLPKALGRILAKDLVARISMPPFDKSAMDGYAIRSADPATAFQVMEMIPAGAVPTRALKDRECAKIMTGGMLPRGADRVIRLENACDDRGYLRIIETETSRNICYKG